MVTTIGNHSGREEVDNGGGYGRKGSRTRDQIANICWLIEKAREFQKNTYFCFIPDHLTCLLKNLYAGQEATVRTNGLVPNWERSMSRLYTVTLLI